MRYRVHYSGWNNRYDEWLRRDRIVSVIEELGEATTAKPKPGAASQAQGKVRGSVINITQARHRQPGAGKGAR